MNHPITYRHLFLVVLIIIGLLVVRHLGLVTYHRIKEIGYVEGRAGMLRDYATSNSLMLDSRWKCSPSKNSRGWTYCKTDDAPTTPINN